MRACEPERTGTVSREGVRIGFEVYGEGEETLLLMPTWSIIHSRQWKAQIPYLARHFRVVTFDGRGSGRSDRPADPAQYREEEFAADALAVMEATGTGRALLVSLSMGAIRSLILAAEHPDRVCGLALIAPSLRLTPLSPERASISFTDPLDRSDGWARFNQHQWRRDFRGFVEFFFSRMFTEPHSTKQIEDCVGWALEGDAETLIRATLAPKPDREELLALCARVRSPALVIHGEQDEISPVSRGRALSEALGAELVVMEGSGHGPHARDPVPVNLLLREFAERVLARQRRPERRWRRARLRPRRALMVSSPIGLGHAQRDVAIARELRALVPGLEIHWLAQDPVTRVLEAEGERVHPASAHLVSESRHIEREATEHELHCFQAIRRMDEILLANFMVFHDLVSREPYDLWIGDEAWEIDHFLHEVPELKRAPNVWISDFVGWLPMPEGGAHERFLTADRNAEMIGHIGRHPHVRDRAIFIGDPDDVVPHTFGEGLPRIREWTEEHFTFAGYVDGAGPGPRAERATLRAELGFAPGERVCLVSVGGSGVGEHLLRRVISALPLALERVPGLRPIVVCGPRIDPASLSIPAGVEVRGYVHNLHRHLAACDVAVVQGGLTTTMELTSADRPFLFFPLRRHFEQNFHVRHRLERYGAGRCMDYGSATPKAIADALVEEMSRARVTRPVEPGGARRAAQMIAELL